MVLEPLCKSGDREGAHWSPDGVTMPEGFKEAYQQFCDNGWPALRSKAEFGGQNVPSVLGTAVEELWAASNLAFKLCPMLTQGAIEAIQHFGTPQQKQLYLPKMVSGQWTGTMNLTEPQAGSDLAQVRTRATPTGPNYRIYGQKIFITYGEHDMAENIVHMVLARIDGAPPGVRGISLFIVPKFWVNADGTPGARNDLFCASIEHKLGIPRQPHLRDDVRRKRRRARPAGGRTQPRPGIHVRDDECRAAVGRSRRLRAGRTRIPAGRRVGAHPRPGKTAGAAREDLGLCLDGNQLLAGSDHWAS
jgi:hypothetical protein